MLRYTLILFCLVAAQFSFGQSLKKYPIGNSGCSAYFFCDPGNFSIDKSQDGSDVYTGECSKDDATYGMICVKLKENISDLSTAEETLIAYLDFLKQSMKITKAVGYGKGHRLKNQEDTRGVIDYWEDGDANNWKVKGWTNGRFISVLYVYTKKELPESKVNVYLESLRFPGM